MSSITAQTVVSAPIANVADIGATAGLNTLPNGFPSSIIGPLAWVGNDFDNCNDWIYHLTESDVGEVRKAVALFKGQCYTSASHIKPSQSFLPHDILVLTLSRP